MIESNILLDDFTSIIPLINFPSKFSMFYENLNNKENIKMHFIS